VEALALLVREERHPEREEEDERVLDSAYLRADRGLGAEAGLEQSA